MRMKRLKTLGACALLALFLGSSVHAQFNPDGYIRGTGWNTIVPLEFGTGCDGGGLDRMVNEQWLGTGVDLYDAVGFNPRAGEVQPLVDGPTWKAAAISADPIWADPALLNATFPPADPPVAEEREWDRWLGGNVLNYQEYLVDLEQVRVAEGLGGEAIPNDNVYAVSTTYVELAAAETLQLCGGSDDSLMFIVNNLLVGANSVCRGGGDCQDSYWVDFPAGVSKITMLVFEGGGGFNGRLQIKRDGFALNDASEGIVFLGGAAPSVGQDQSGLERGATRSVAALPFNCPPDAETPVTVTIKGSGATDGGATTVVEEFRASNSPAIEITGEGWTVEDILTRAPEPVGVYSDNTVVGNPCGPANSTTEDAGVYTSVATTGGDIWDGGDIFQYGYAQLQGDFDVTLKYLAREHATGEGRWGKFGLMARASLATTARYTIIQDHVPDLQDSVRLAGRTVASGGGGMYEDAINKPDTDPAEPWHPTYVRLKRAGNIVTGYASDDVGVETDPTNDTLWTKVGRDDDWADLATDTLLVGFANSDHNSNGCATQTITYELYNWDANTEVPLAPQEVIGKRATKETDLETLAGDGVSYQLAYSETENVSISGSLPQGDVLPLTTNVLFENNQTGEIGVFNNAHNIGGVVMPGGTTFDGIAYTVEGAGADIWQSGDEFQFAYKVVTGDFVATARAAERIDPVSGGRWGKTGLMARYSCDRAAKYSLSAVMLATNPAEVDQPRHQIRLRDGDAGSSVDGWHVVDDGALKGWPGTGDNSVDRRPEWHRLVRIGQTIYSFLAYDDGEGNPLEWCLVGSDSQVGRPAEHLVGLAVNAHAGTTGPTGTVVYDNVSITGLDPDNGQAASPGDSVAEINFEDPVADLGIVVQRGGGFTPAVVDGRLRLTQNDIASSANAVWYGAAYSTDAGGVPLSDTGFVVEFDAFMTKTEGHCDDPAIQAPADGFGLACVAVGANDALATALAPFPAGLDAASLGGDGGGAEGFDGGTLRQRTECHNNFMVELDNWAGGGDPPNEGTGSNQVPCTYHVGLNVNGSVSSVQINSQFGVPDTALPDIFGPAGVHVTVAYQSDGRVDAFVKSNDPEANQSNLHVLSQRIPPLPSGDLLIGFTGGTGGATATQEVDNMVVSFPCLESPDSVTITDCPELASTTTPVTLNATTSGDDGDWLYAWAVTGGTVVSGQGSATVEVLCEEGDVVVSVSASDGVCNDAATDSCSFFCEQGGVQMIPGDMNLDANLDISDPVAGLNFLFAGIALPECLVEDDGAGGVQLTAYGIILGDWNGDGGYDISDPVGGLNFLFAGGSAHVLGEGCQVIEGDTTCESNCVIDG